MINKIQLYNHPLENIAIRKSLITTINAHCYNVALHDSKFREVLLNSSIVIPDGIGIVLAVRLLSGQKIKKIAGADLFNYEMNRLQKNNGKCFFLGSTNSNLQRIKEKIKDEYPNVKVETFSPPFKAEFSEEDNYVMIRTINNFRPDVLMIGMTAPKQEKWAYENYKHLQVGHVCCIGAVFDYYAGTISRAPKWMITAGLEWLYRLIKEPKRMWRRYLIGNWLFIVSIFKEKIKSW